LKLPFRLPPQISGGVSPSWDGQYFVSGVQKLPVLEYSENFAGWSDDLTSLHEQVVGDSHPIDLASRYSAIEQIKTIEPSDGAVIMEIGCSSGFLIRELLKSFPKAIIIGADVVKEPLYKLAKSIPGVPLIRFDLLQCPLPKKSVDILVMLNVLEHIENDVVALEKAYNILKPGGTLVIEVPACPALYDEYDAELQHFRRYNSFDLVRKVTHCGFQIIRKTHLGCIIFPAFAVVKLLNKYKLFRKRKSVVKERAARTSNNILVRLAMKFESKYLSTFKLPFGVRIIVVARRPL
jgi:SAM-dependent methyltransferase